MTNATITLLGRATLDGDFSELWIGSVEVGDGTASVSPAVPASAVGYEFMLSVLSDNSVNFASFVVIPGEPAAEGEPAVAPVTPRFERVTSVYATQGAKAQRAPFKGQLVALCQVGTPQPAV